MRFEQLAAPRGAPDDLTKLNGVGPELETTLNDGGIFHYWQIAAMTEADIAKVDADLKLQRQKDHAKRLGRPGRKALIEEAAA